MNSRAPEIVIYLRTYLHVSFHSGGVNSLRVHSVLLLHEQTRIVTTRLVLTVVILNSIEASGQISNGSEQVNPLPTGLNCII